MATRPYQSPLRKEQLERTRDHLLEVAREILVEEGVDGLSIPRVAKRAAVSIPTVYRHFPATDDLLRGLLEWIRPRVGMSPDRLLDRSPESLPDLPLENFERYEDNAALLRPLMDSAAFNRVRVGSVNDRKERAVSVIRGIGAGWPEDELEAAAGTLFALSSPQTWRWMRETWALPNALAARASSWAIRALIETIENQPGLARRPGHRDRRKKR